MGNDSVTNKISKVVEVDGYYDKKVVVDTVGYPYITNISMISDGMAYFSFTMDAATVKALLEALTFVATAKGWIPAERKSVKTMQVERAGNVVYIHDLNGEIIGNVAPEYMAVFDCLFSWISNIDARVSEKK